MDGIDGNIEKERAGNDAPTSPEGIARVAEPPIAASPPTTTQTLAATTTPTNGRVRRVLKHWSTGWFVAALLVGVVAGLSVALAMSPTSTFARVRYGFAGPVPFFRLAPQAGPLPDERGLPGFGTVDSVGQSSFTMTTFGGAKLTVDEQSSTVYRSESGGTGSKSSVQKGDRVVVVGTRTGSIVMAAQVIVLPSDYRFGPRSRSVFVPAPLQ